MSSKVTTIDRAIPSKRSRRWLDALARRTVLERLRRLEVGSLRVAAGEDEWRFGAHAAHGLAATVRIHDERTFADLAFGGSIGAAEAYLLGYWDADDLTSVLRVLLANRTVLDDLESGAARVKAPLQRALHWLNRNTLAGSQRNIAAHYDLGNEFFALWLDPSLMYSAAIFESPATTLEEASAAKNEIICRKLRLTETDRQRPVLVGTRRELRRHEAFAFNGLQCVADGRAERVAASPRRRVAHLLVDLAQQALARCRGAVF